MNVQQLEHNGHTYRVGDPVHVKVPNPGPARILELEDRGPKYRAAVVQREGDGVPERERGAPTHLMVHQLEPRAVVRVAPAISPATLSRADVERARDMLQHVSDVAQAKAIADEASTLEHLVRRRNAGLEAQTHATEIVIWSRRRIGELTSRIERGAGPGRGKKAPHVGHLSAELERLGISRAELSRCELLARTDEAIIRAHCEAVREQLGKLTLRGTIAAVSASADYDGDEWSTEERVIVVARKLNGGRPFGCDPATNAAAQRMIRALVHYTKAHNGLKRKWPGSIWLNPPYSRGLIDAFVMRWLSEKASAKRRKFLLVNAATDTGWCQVLLRARVPYIAIEGRLRHAIDGKLGGPARSPQLLFVDGVRDVEALQLAAAELGGVACRAL